MKAIQGYTMNSMYDDVARFHIEVLKVERPPLPSLVSDLFTTEKVRFLNEELEEYATAAYEGDLVKATDGLLDLIYVALGTLYSMGVPVNECWNAVQAANMQKVRGVTHRGNEVDAAKPANWLPPDIEIARIIGEAIDASHD
jgi:predicted HAD superfamily Cof-like phosphohydrolase